MDSTNYQCSSSTLLARFFFLQYFIFHINCKWIWQGCLMKVPLVKNVQKWNLHFRFWYLRHVLYWWCIWKRQSLRSSKNYGSVSGWCSRVIRSSYSVYSSIFSDANFDEFRIQKTPPQLHNTWSFLMIYLLEMSCNNHRILIQEFALFMVRYLM